MSEEVVACKNAGNELFSAERYTEAYDVYTQAIEINQGGDSSMMSILYCNRALTNLKLENYGDVIADANQALEFNPDNFKACYHRASANLVLGKLDEAKKDLVSVVKLRPRDKVAREKLNECVKAKKKLKFSQAIQSSYSSIENPNNVLNYNDMVVEDSYNGPHLGDEVTLEFVMAMIEHFRNQGTLHLKYLYQILLMAKDYFKEQPNMVSINIGENEHFTVCGDVHGQFYDVLNIFNLNGYPSTNNPYLFNGDFVDRGSFSCEVIITFLAFKLLYPDHFYMARGNHETKSLHKMYGFEGEVLHKYNASAYELFCETFCFLPLCHLINEKIFVTHGGLFSDDFVTLSDIQNINRNCEPPMTGLMSDILWADPQFLPGRMPSKRGIGYSFGPDVTESFLSRNNLSLVIRSHEVKFEGFEYHHQGKLITIFSAPNYCDSIGNKGAFIKLTSALEPEITSFTHVPHPPIPAMKYSSHLFGF
eukprot:TRINITY_DN3204_c0_g1_i1.p1 TRINITY_DN3204_c0_g1~~TRINITY_DN3204_c0_g1_i1.p1  ORF type:complete len:478 (-),score=88.94 TRINITY_DN3204_c0_g1_i1:637-2070(-)